MKIELDTNKCLEILKEYTKSESLLKHAYAVEACVKYYADKCNEDKVYWGNIALLHDFDYEKYPSEEEHPAKGAQILESLGFEEEFVQTILSHADYSGVPRDTLLKKVLYACDELAGFITAVTLVRPNKSIEEVQVKSVKKKMKDKGFSKAVSRDDIRKGAEELGIDLDEHITNCIEAMKLEKEKLEL